MTFSEQLCKFLVARDATVGLVGFEKPAIARLTLPLATSGYQVLVDSPEGTTLGTNASLGAADVLVLNARIELTPARGVDARTMNQTLEVLGSALHPGQLVVVSGPVPPGMTRAVLLPVLASRGVFLAYTPNIEGSSFPRVVGGLNLESQELAALFLSQAFGPTLPVSSLEAAELSGLLESVSRVTQAALGHELQVLCDHLGVNACEIINASGLRELAPKLINCGPAPLLVWSARRFGVSARLIELAVEINLDAPRTLLAKIEETLNQFGKSLRGSRVLLLGLADAEGHQHDWPGVELIAHLEKKSACVVYHDPRVLHLTPVIDRHGSPRSSAPLTAELLESQDVVVVVGEHASGDPGFLLAHSKLVVGLPTFQSPSVRDV